MLQSAEGINLDKKKIFYLILIVFVLYFSGCLGWFFWSTSSDPNRKTSKIGPSPADFPSSSTQKQSVFSSPEELMDQYVKAYRRKDTVVLLTLISDEWIKKQGKPRSELSQKMEEELESLERKFGPVIGWELPAFNVYDDVAIVKSKIKRKSGFTGQTTFVLVKREGSWRILEVIGGSG